ncbi:type III CRISPR-associated RAMP protein Csx7 [Thermostichus vulcanus]|uniref:CRISPR-associated RAMP protein n=1 Tax=Thermostichus vulcanus str. 'Rupite' TaxID=2813851 RepID=A0ABT0C9F8_THEVL|nr:CRISPR-associated RAMP protein Csx7 [Thermostichus vulcanus]MCJ2542408.1 CRISPR-associated RAMP protein [Thermostichus vulcanus str. 'Rupite']
MFDIFKNRLEITGILTTVTALRIGAGRSTEPIGSDLPVLKDAVGRPIIPGSSFKGAMRSRLESFLRGIDPSLAKDPSELTSSEQFRIINDLKQNHKNNDAALTEALLGVTDLVSQVFGSPWLAGKVQIRDLPVVPSAWFGQYQERDGVAIDRDTETASDGKLYDFQVVPANTPFEFHAVVENAQEWELGLFTIGLHQFETEQIPLGGGRSRGLGVVQLDILETYWFDSEGDPQRLLRYLQELVRGSRQPLSPETAQAYRQDWVEALITKLRTTSQLQPTSIGA